MNQTFRSALTFLVAMVLICWVLVDTIKVSALTVGLHGGESSAFDFKFTTNCAGTVRDLSGVPVPGVQITFYPGGFYANDEFSESVTDAKGHYMINAPKARAGIFEGRINSFGSIVARDTKRNLAAAEIFNDGRTNVDLVLKPALTVAGTVTDTEGHPIGGAAVAFRIQTEASSVPLDNQPIKTDGQGKFMVTTIPQGCGADISGIQAKGYGSCWLSVRAQDMQTNRYSFPTIMLKKADCMLAGRVIGPDEKPFPGATVRFRGKGQPMETNYFMTTKTDTRGNFIFNEVCDGDVWITAQGMSDEAFGHVFMSSAVGSESIFHVGEKNIVIKVVDRDFASFETTPLHKAARDGDTNLVKVLITNHADLNAKEKDGRTPLHWAALNGHLEVVNLLLVNGAAVDAVENDGKTPLHCAAMNDHFEIVKLLLANGAKIDDRERAGITPLHETAIHGQEDITALLLASNAEVNVKAGNGNTSLHWAAMYGQIKVAEVLLANGAEVNPMNNNGQTPLHWAIQNRQTDVADLLRQHGGLESGYAAGKPANAPANWNTSAFRGAIQNGDVNEVEKLLKDDASLINFKDEQKRTPLILAAMANRGPVVELLLSHKADIDAEDMFGRTALDWTALVGAKDAAQILTDNKADFNAKAEDGITPLHIAARNGFQGVTEVLVAHGADVNARDKQGNTPLQWVEAELRVGPPADQGTPLARIYAAKLKGRKDVAEWLRQHGGKE
jgi:ankyrin repeat protein